MPGSYCHYCKRRCFVIRVLPPTGKEIHMATCAEGAAYDRRSVGYDYQTATNPSGDQIRRTGDEP